MNATEKAAMAKKRDTGGGYRSQDRHKGGRMVRIREALVAIIEQSAADNLSQFTPEVNRLLMIALRAEGKWPPRSDRPQ